VLQESLISRYRTGSFLFLYVCIVIFIYNCVIYYKLYVYKYRYVCYIYRVVILLQGACMTTEYGKYLRKLRIDTSERVTDMAKRLGISAAYLSLIENGTREVPSDFSYRIWKEYRLSPEQTGKLQEAESRTPKKTVTIDLEPVQDKWEYVATAVLFGNCFAKLNDAQIRELDDLLHRFVAESNMEGVIGDFS
jgi:HTH-type transcriptional regulator, competence development regulator